MTFTNSALTTINDCALKDSSITTVTLPTTVTTLGESVFENTPLTKFTGTGIDSVGKACFKNCSLTTSPTLKSTTTILPEEFCSYTKSYTGPLTKISIPSGCVRIEPAAFDNLLGMNVGNPQDNWSAFQKISGPNVEHIGTNNFKICGFGAYKENNQYLIPTVINFPKLKTLKHNCFYFGSPGSNVYWKYYNTGYYKINFASLETMGHGNFFHFPFKQITATEFPKLKSIGQGCFRQNDMLTTVNLPLLEKIKNPSDETNSSEFLWCDDYKTTTNTDLSPWSECPNLTTLLLPNFSNGFTIDLEGCTGLKTIDIGKATYLYTLDLPQLETLVIRNETPPSLYIRRVYEHNDQGYQIARDVDFPTTIKIYVPDPTLYAELDNWQYYYQLGCIKPLSEYAG